MTWSPQGPLRPTAPCCAGRSFDAITTQETLFFRDQVPFEGLATPRDSLPDRCEGPQAVRRNACASWSAACSTGQEPYSIAMTLRDLSDRSSTPGT